MKDIIEINAKIDIARLDTNDYYRSVIKDIDGDSFYIALPIFISQPLFLTPGEKVTVRFTGVSECFIGTSKVVNSIKDSILLYQLTKPKNLERVQKRRFVRFVTLKDVFYAEIPGEGRDPEYIEAKALDISGGGMKLLLDKTYPIASQLLLKFHITNIKGCFQEIQTKVRVVRKEAPKPGLEQFHVLGVEFIELTESLRSKIISFIFREMARVRHLGR